MPLVAHSSLPTFQRLKAEGRDVLSLERAYQQDIREIHIGLLNMMPDNALEATERQFFRLVGESNTIVQIHMHPFTIEGLTRGPSAQQHIDTYYEGFAQIREKGLDGLIISGANVTQPSLQMESFWRPLTEVFEWATQNVTSIMCSCLATHALIQSCYGIERTHMGTKRWGVFSHRVVERRHPLVADINTRFDVPHSRYNEIFRADIEAAGLKVLVESEEIGVHMAVSPDLFRIVFFQGHPEYDTVSLLKEYKREVLRFFNQEREDYPPFPENYFPIDARLICNEFGIALRAAKRRGIPPPEFPETRLLPLLDNTWRDTARAVFDNWLGKIYQTTDQDRRVPFAPGISPENPLGLDI